MDVLNVRIFFVCCLSITIIFLPALRIPQSNFLHRSALFARRLNRTLKIAGVSEDSLVLTEHTKKATSFFFFLGKTWDTATVLKYIF